MYTRRNFGLDLARAIAIAMVFFSHGVSSLDVLGVGVDLFFVLSGFLIGRIYLRAQADAQERPGSYTVWKFWSARWLRTLPPYLAALGLFALAQPYFHTNAVHTYYLLFLQNYVGVDGFGPSWSLCIEEHFYLALPLLGAVALRWNGRRYLAWLLPASALVPQALRTYAFLHGTLPQDWYWRTHLHCEGLLLGVWLAYIFLDRPQVWLRLRGAAALTSVVPPVLLAYQKLHPQQPAWFQSVAFLLYAIGYAGWLRLLYDLHWEPVLPASRLVKRTIHGLALASYSIYLLHTLFFTDIRVLIDEWPRGPLKSGTILFTSLALSVVFYFAVERPSITLRDRLLKR